MDKDRTLNIAIAIMITLMIILLCYRFGVFSVVPVFNTFLLFSIIGYLKRIGEGKE